MKHLNLAFLCLFLFLLPQKIFSQTPNLSISYTKPDGLFVCGSDTLTINIQNTGDAMEAGALLEINLPGGIAYVAGSVSGAVAYACTNRRPRAAIAVKAGVSTPAAPGPIASARVVSSVTSRMDGRGGAGVDGEGVDSLRPHAAAHRHSGSTTPATHDTVRTPWSA